MQTGHDGMLAGLGISRHSQLHRQFKASSGYMKSLFQNQKKKIHSVITDLPATK